MKKIDVQERFRKCTVLSGRVSHTLRATAHVRDPAGKIVRATTDTERLVLLKVAYSVAIELEEEVAAAKRYLAQFLRQNGINPDRLAEESEEM